MVLGEPTYYSRFGFEPARRYGLDSVYGNGDEFMVLSLQPGALPPEGGMVHYADEFAAVGNTEAN